MTIAFSKRHLLKTGLAALVLALAGCGKDAPKTENAPTVAPAPAAGEKVYTVLTYPQYAPYQYFDEKGEIIGFDVDMINAIAESQNMKVQIKETFWVGMLDELNEDKGDLVISGISRQQAGGDTKFALSNAYLHGRDAILSKDSVTHINTMDDMVANHMGAQFGTIFADELTKRKGDKSASLTLAETSYLSFKDVVNDKVQAMYAHENILRHYAKEQPQFKFRFSGTGEGFGYYDMVVVAKKGNEELIQKINAGIAKVHSDGTYRQLHLKWFGVEPPKVN